MCVFVLSGCNAEMPDTKETSNNTEAIPSESTNIPTQDTPQSNIEEKNNQICISLNKGNADE